MIRLKHFSGTHPVLFSFFILITWFLVASIATIIIASLLQVPFLESLPQSFGSLVATIYIVLISWKFGWLRSSGIGSLGSSKAWLITLIALVYLIFAYSYAFFNDFTIIEGTYLTEIARPVILRQMFVGLVEEVLFRGVILYALVRVWGGSKRGLLFAVLLSAILFGSVHLLQAFAGRSVGLALIASLESIVSGLWWGAIAVLTASVWPAVVLHAGSNAFVLSKVISYPGLEFSNSEYWLAMLLQLPLVILSLYLLSRSAPRPVVPNLP